MAWYRLKTIEVFLQKVGWPKPPQTPLFLRHCINGPAYCSVFNLMQVVDEKDKLSRELAQAKQDKDESKVHIYIYLYIYCKM